MDTNPITGDRLVGKGENSEKFKDSWERTFGETKPTEIQIPFMWSTEIGGTKVDNTSD